VIGGGDGGCLREIARHDTVTEVNIVVFLNTRDRNETFFLLRRL
jgi:predicted membrane-bound spermidine synthase